MNLPDSFGSIFRIGKRFWSAHFSHLARIKLVATCYVLLVQMNHFPQLLATSILELLVRKERIVDRLSACGFGHEPAHELFWSFTAKHPADLGPVGENPGRATGQRGNHNYDRNDEGPFTFARFGRISSRCRCRTRGRSR